MHMSKLTRARGFTLMELLVAIVVLAIGLLGLAGLQALGLRNNTSAYHRTQATILAYDMIDRMRANRARAIAGSYDVALNTAPSGNTDCTGTGATCSAADMATFDLNQWKCSLGKWNGNAVCTNTLDISGLLPDGDGAVVRNNEQFTVQVRWIDDRDGNTVSLEIDTELQ
jgi:type IV pilus assembly protein PilV